MAQGSAFPVKEQVDLAFMKISSAVWSPEGPRVFFQLFSATSWLWLGDKMPSDSVLAQHCTMSRSVPSVLICSAQRCLFCTIPTGACQLLCQETGTRHSGFKEVSKAEARERAYALEGRVEEDDRGLVGDSRSELFKGATPSSHLPRTNTTRILAFSVFSQLYLITQPKRFSGTA